MIFKVENLVTGKLGYTIMPKFMIGTKVIVNDPDLSGIEDHEGVIDAYVFDETRLVYSVKFPSDCGFRTFSEDLIKVHPEETNF